MRCRRVLPAFAAVLAAALAGCVAAPAVHRSETPTAAESSVAAVARRIEAVSPRGRLDAKAREAMLRRVAAQGDGDLVRRHLAAMADFGDVDLTTGNAAQLLVDGPQTFAAMFAAIEAARSSVLLESYIVEDGDVAQRLAALLRRKRDEGVAVALIYDAVGSVGTDRGFFDGLRAAGVAVCEFNPLNPAARPGLFGRIDHRDHRKILVVDRETGFTGGINVSSVYSTGSFGRRQATDRRREGWRDTQIRLRGPAAATLDDLVRETWARQRCPGALPAPPAVRVAAAGSEVVRIVPASPGEETSRIYALLLAAIDASQRSVLLTMAYFAPGTDMVDALCDAARRGVDVQLVLPSVSDFAPVLHAGRRHYARLLEAGVKIHELQHAVLHAKTAVIDGVVSTVGSSNMDWRSFSANDEVNAVVLGADFGDAMAALFARDLAASQPVTLQDWRRRPLGQRLLQGLAGMFERVW